MPSAIGRRSRYTKDYLDRVYEENERLRKENAELKAKLDDRKPCPDCPVLRGEDARRFLEKMEQAKNNPLPLRPVPNIEKAKEFAMKNIGVGNA